MLLLLLALPSITAAQELRVYLVTVGPGELPYERFGHNALLFENPATGVGFAYDWGRFDFNQPNFIGRFVMGDMLYSSGRDPGEEMLGFYVEVQKRRVVVQELNLSPAQASALRAACEEGYKPENRQYKYDYFIENCSVKLRDALDSALGGQIRAQLSPIQTSATYRGEAERHLAAHWFIWFGIHAAFGMPGERPISAWEHTFLPEELRRWVAVVEIINQQGEPVPLVLHTVVFNEGAPGSPPRPPSRWWQTGLIGVFIGAAMLLLLRLRSQRPARSAAAIWFFFAGLVGILLLWGWGFTGHWVGYQNQTILLLSPLGLPLALTTLVRRWDRLTIWLAAAHLGLCVLGTLLHLLPGIGQENAAIVALALPANAAAAWVVGIRWRPAGRTSANAAPAPA